MAYSGEDEKRETSDEGQSVDVFLAKTSPCGANNQRAGNTTHSSALTPAQG